MDWIDILLVHFKTSVYTSYFVPSNGFNDLHLNAWDGRYQSVLRADIKYKVKVEVPRPFLCMPWIKDLSIDYCPYNRVTKLSIDWNCSGK